MFNARVKVELGLYRLAKCPRNVHSFFEHEEQYNRLPNRNVISVGICFVFHTYINNWPLQPFSQDY